MAALVAVAVALAMAAFIICFPHLRHGSCPHEPYIIEHPRPWFVRTQTKERECKRTKMSVFLSVTIDE
jgi:hypothetical protein